MGFPCMEYGGLLLPHFYLECAQDIAPYVEHIQQVFDSLTDENSRSIFLERLQALLSAPFVNLQCCESGLPYLAPEILEALPS